MLVRAQQYCGYGAFTPRAVCSNSETEHGSPQPQLRASVSARGAGPAPSRGAPRTLWDEPFPWEVHPVSVRCDDETLRLLQLFPPKVLPLNLLCLPSGGIVRYPNSLRCVEFLTFSAYEISNAPCYLYNLKRSSLKFYMWHLCEPYVIWQNTFNMSF